MTRHRFDPLSAVLGLLAVAVGITAATNRIDRFDLSADGWLIALIPLALGLALFPRRAAS